MEKPNLLHVSLHFMLLAAISVGGGGTVLPEMQRYIVEVNHLMTGREFAELFALAQAAPGPNIMYVTMIGLRIGGWKGALATTLATLGPVAILAYTVSRVSARGAESTLGRAMRSGLSPMTVGLTFSTGWVLVHAANHGWPGYLLTAVSAVLVLRTRLSPLWIIVGGALAGIAGLT